MRDWRSYSVKNSVSVDKKEQVSTRKFQWLKIEACLYRSNSMLSSKNKNNYSEKK